jgi:hypothetical protein
MRLAYLAIVGVFAAAAACGDSYVTGNAASDPGGGGAGATGGQGAAAGAGDAGGCDAMVPELPDGWTGPFALALGSVGGLQCPGGDMPTMRRHLVLPDESLPCDCDCTAVADNCLARIATYNTLDCSGGGSELSLHPACNDTAPITNSVEYLSAAPSASKPLCEVGEGATPPAVDEKGAAFCPLAVRDGCTHLPDPPFEGALCIEKDGVHDCPEGFSDGFLLAKAYTDPRGCDCSCSEGSAECTGQITFHGNGGCSSAGESEEIGQCKEIVATAIFYDAATTGSCQLQTDAVTGAVQLDSPETVCCIGS